MRKVCLSLPTNRECAATISAMAAEAAYAAEHFDVKVHLIASASSLAWAMGAVALSAILVSLCATQIRWPSAVDVPA
jgi:hypothetical protein